MIWSLLATLWVVFLAVFGCVLCTARRGARVLGVAFPADKMNDPAVKRILRRFYAELSTVFVLSAAAGFLLFLPSAKPLAELWMLLILAAFLALSWLAERTAQRRLFVLRAQKGWVLPARKTLSADLTASRDKVKGALSPAFVWVCFALSFIPAAVLLAVPTLRADFPLPFALLGPAVQLAAVALYYGLRNVPVRTKGEDSSAAVAYAQQSIRLHSVSAVVMAVSLLVFWLLFCFSSCFLQNYYLTIAAFAILVLANLAAAFWENRKQRKLDETYLEVRAPEAESAGGEWKWGCYYDPQDPRIFVPKPVESLGWTVNIGRPAGKAIMLVLLAFVVCIVALVGVMTLSGFSVEVQNGQLQMDAPFYDLTLTREQVESVELVDTLPANGTRTNGYGGVSKSYGISVLTATVHACCMSTTIRTHMCACALRAMTPLMCF